jgi:hypothetical protein
VRHPRHPATTWQWPHTAKGDQRNHTSTRCTKPMNTTAPDGIMRGAGTGLWEGSNHRRSADTTYLHDNQNAPGPAPSIFKCCTAARKLLNTIKTSC